MAIYSRLQRYTAADAMELPNAATPPPLLPLFHA